MTPRRVISPAARPPGFTYRQKKLRAHRTAQQVLYAEELSLSVLAAKFGTPLYIYSDAAIRTRYTAFDRAFRGIPHTICYSVKANSNLSILRLLAKQGCGFDVVSGGELERVLTIDRKAANRVVFSGVGKTRAELTAALKARIMLFNVESAAELGALAECAQNLRVTAPLAFRVNPDVAAETHPYISTGLHKHKFGVPIAGARELYRSAAAKPNLQVLGVSVHIGSQITNIAPFREAMTRVAELVRNLRADGHQILYVDAGGGLGIDYNHSNDRNFLRHASSYAQSLIEPLRALDVHLLLEPGRSIVGPAGLLLSRVIYTKENNGKRFVIVDAAMNDLIRPALYGAYHEIIPVVRKFDGSAKCETVDVVGPVCETGDFFARDRELPSLAEGDLLAILDAGAYGMTLSSNYNTRPRPAEVMVRGRSARLTRRRETVKELLRGEL